MHNFKGKEGPWFADGYDIFAKGGDYHVCEVSKDLNEETEEANINLLSAAPDLLAALQWALPLAKVAMQSHRALRVQCGHTDIVGKNKNGEGVVGLYQDEIDKAEKAEVAINKALGINPDE